MKNNIYIYIYIYTLKYFATHHKLTQHCKSSILKKKKSYNKKERRKKAL